MEITFGLKKLFLRAAMLVTALMGTANVTLADDVTVGDVSNSECGNRTRTESFGNRAMLKLTRTENGLVCELRNYGVNCGYHDVNVMCQEDGQDIAINVDDGIGAGDDGKDCGCRINIYFTIFNALKDEYQLTLDGRNVGTVSFMEHSVVNIDLVTLAQAYEEGFEYPVRVQGFWVFKITDDAYLVDVLNQSLYIGNNGDKMFSCDYKNYVLPCDYNYLDVQAEIGQDSTLVINVLTDGVPDEKGKRMGDLIFDIVNLFKETYHLQLNQTILYGSENQATTCIYEGDVTVPQEGRVIIPLGTSNHLTAIQQQMRDSDFGTSLFDLQGRRINGKPERGIYIQDGRKIVLK